MSLFKKINEGANSLAIKAISIATEGKPQSRKTLKAKKILSVVMACALTVTMCTINAFAAELPEFFTTAIDTLGTVVLLIGGGIGVWGVINLLEGYSNDNPGAKSQGMKQLMAGVGIALIGIFLIPELATFMETEAGNAGGGAGA